MNMILIICYLLSGLLIPNQWNHSEQMNMITRLDGNPLVAAIGKTAEEIRLASVNHITLYDDVAAVIEKKGAPDRITTDPYFEDAMTFSYSDMNISFTDDAVQQIQIEQQTETLYLDDTEVEATIEAIQSALGEPDYIAEDGIVFQRQEALLKLYIDPENGKLESITYYHIAST